MEYQYCNNRNDFFFDCLSLNNRNNLFSKVHSFFSVFIAMLPIFQLYAHQYIIRANFFYCFDFWLTYMTCITNITRTCVKSLKLVC